MKFSVKKGLCNHLKFFFFLQISITKKFYILLKNNNYILLNIFLRQISKKLLFKKKK